MPRYRFSWENLPPQVQADLLVATRCSTLEDLRANWRARPTDLFVKEHREALTRSWLARDDAARRSIVERLRTGRFGDYARQPRSARAEFAYLASCRNARGFRAIVLDELIRLGEVPGAATLPDASDEVPRRVSWRNVSTSGEPPAFTPYQHQSEAWRALDAAVPVRGGLLVLPTGAGKTVTAVRWILRNVLSGADHRPVLWLAHRSELLDQAAETFAHHAAVVEGRSSIGIRCVSSAHGRRAPTILQPADVVCATVASLQREPEIVKEYFVRHPDAFVVVDEAHHAAARSYTRLIESARGSRRVQILGLTATPTRTVEAELGLLRKAFPDGILYSVESSRLIAEGILARRICESVGTGLDFEVDLSPSELSYLGRFGDLSPTTLNRIASHTARNAMIANRYVQFRQEYGQTLVFAASIAHCYTLAEELKGRGVRADFVAYVRGDVENKQVIDSFKKKKLDVVLTVTKLTEGIDLPSVATVFLARPTGSRILLSQMVGRGMRGATVTDGTTDVRVVSFDDHWERFSDWLDPIEFLDAPITERPDRDPVKREMIDVPWAVYLEIARLARRDPGPVTGVVSRPVGWFDLSMLPLQSGGLRTVVVFQHQRDGFESLIEDALAGEAEGSGEELAASYFNPFELQPSTRALEIVLRFVDEVGAAPLFVQFDVMDRHAPDMVARQIEGLSVPAAEDEIERVYQAHPMVAALYPDLRSYVDAVFDVRLDRRFGDDDFTEHTIVDLAENTPELPAGDHDLSAIASRVSVQMGLGGAIPDIGWAKRTRRSYWAVYLARPCRIVVNPVLKTSAIQPDTMDFLVYHELLHHDLGVEAGHGPEFRTREKQFPGWFDAQADLDTLEERFRVWQEAPVGTHRRTVIG